MAKKPFYPYSDRERLYMTDLAHDAGDTAYNARQAGHGVLLAESVLERLYTELSCNGSGYADGVEVAIQRVRSLGEKVNRRVWELDACEGDGDDYDG